VRMPGLTGLETLRLRATAATLPVLLVTAFTDVRCRPPCGWRGELSRQTD
jgi:FixJ family two-component response regulator